MTEIFNDLSIEDAGTIVRLSIETNIKNKDELKSAVRAFNKLYAAAVLWETVRTNSKKEMLV